MARVTAYVIVVIAAATPWLEVLLVVPAAIVAGLSPVPVVVLAAVGNALTIVPVVLAGDALRDRWYARRRHRSSSSDPRCGDVDEPVAGSPRGARGRGRRLFDRYGLPGLALLGPLVTGIHLAALVAVGAGAHRRATLLWLSAGVTIWAAAAAALTLLGLEAFVDPDRLPDLFARP
jgi:Ca2+/H+ antiporter, TMEM165/GDT1 family